MKTLSLLLLLPLLFSSVGSLLAVESNKAKATLIQEMHQSLEKDILSNFYPRVIDNEYGGYISNWTWDWDPMDRQAKMVVTQARHIWTSSKAATFTGDNETWLPIAEHGFKYLRDVMWDSEHGGFHWMLDLEGKPITYGREKPIRYKQAYGISFAIYALAAYYEVSKDTEALELAKQAFYWLEDHAHDPEHLGYFNNLQSDGTPYKDWLGLIPPKDQNSSIHLMEAFSELYLVWKDPLLKKRLEEMLHLVRDVQMDERGFIYLFFEADWTPVSYRNASAEERKKHRKLDHVSFGHDIEIAYLMLEAEEVLGNEHPTKTLEIAKRITDHVLQYGWDHKHGGVWDGGYYNDAQTDCAVVMHEKGWWAQAEAMNTFQIMAELYPDDSQDYHARFIEAWNYIHTYLIDHENGGWYGEGTDQSPDIVKAAKAHLWKANYHDGRTLFNCLNRLKGTSGK